MFHGQHQEAFGNHEICRCSASGILQNNYNNQKRAFNRYCFGWTSREEAKNRHVEFRQRVVRR